MNINAIQQPRGVTQSQEASRKSERVSAGSTEEATSSQEAGTVKLSSHAKALADFPPLLLPNRENVQKLSSALSEDLKKLFNEAGIDSTPPVEFAVDPYTGQVSVKGNRPDTQQIADLVKGHRDIEMQIRNIAGMSSHVVALGKAMEASQAYRAAQSAAEVNNVIARYSSVYSGHIDVHNFSLVFNGVDVQVNADGQTWMTSKT